MHIQLSFVQFSLLCYEFCILSKTECKSIYYHFRHDHESSSFPKLARNKWICRETYDFFFRDQFTLAKKILVPLHSLNNIEITNYFNYQPRFNGVFSRNNLPKKKMDRMS